ncbi:hypothetical protein GCM10027079_02690 [Sediminivirga luteola]|uniref:HNH nuclease domain-containing protein n=1 Tax=Sediminivirga luteola TaxID=1774748 RepID=A0A8J2XK42_9MICO|nr:hypothetical protein GCM10011333_11960 [Sediminivirga luteola]
MPDSTCTIDGCDRRVTARGWCTSHYKRWYRHGDPEAGASALYETPEEAFSHRTEMLDGHLIWTGARNEHGYGVIWDGNRTRLVHRWNWERERGPIPDELDLDHRCGVPACCNPEHLRVVSAKQNAENRVRLPSNNTSGYRGVYWSASRGKWFAKAKHHGHQYHGGYFDSPEAANEAAIALRNRLFTHNDRDRAA